MHKRVQTTLLLSSSEMATGLTNTKTLFFCKREGGNVFTFTYFSSLSQTKSAQLNVGAKILMIIVINTVYPICFSENVKQQNKLYFLERMQIESYVHFNKLDPVFL